MLIVGHDWIAKSPGGPQDGQLESGRQISSDFLQLVTDTSQTHCNIHFWPLTSKTLRNVIIRKYFMQIFIGQSVDLFETGKPDFSDYCE